MCAEKATPSRLHKAFQVWKAILKNRASPSTISLEMASSILLAAGLKLKREAAKEHQMTGYVDRCCWNEMQIC